jgi:three-Cys-motif partner protein
MGKKNFFDNPTESSKVKIAIVEKYFKAWKEVILASQKKNKISDQRLAYIDLFAGPGGYKDGTKSTPLLILETAIADERLRERLVTVFNDINKDFIDHLKEVVCSIPDIDKLKNKPTFLNEEVGEEIVAEFKKVETLPTLFFIDPWGYKGLSRDLILATVEGWGCDCILFFNYNRIVGAINNKHVERYIDSIFGQEGAKELRRRWDSYDDPKERELAIIEFFCNGVKESGKEKGIEYILPFKVESEKGKRTSHYLIFISKNRTGYKIMKDIMSKSSSDQDVSFEYSSATPQQSFLFNFNKSIEDLSENFLTCFAGETLSVKQIIEEASKKYYVDTPYVEKNYRAALRLLESAQKVQTDPPADKRPKRKQEVTFGDTVEVTFPART